MTELFDNSTAGDDVVTNRALYAGLVTVGGAGGLNSCRVDSGVTYRGDARKTLVVVAVIALLAGFVARDGAGGGDSRNVLKLVTECGNYLKARNVLLAENATLTCRSTVLGTGGGLFGNRNGSVCVGNNGTAELDVAAGLTHTAGLVTLVGAVGLYLADEHVVVSGGLGSYGSDEDLAAKITFCSGGRACLGAGSRNGGDSYFLVRATAGCERKHYAHNCNRKHEKLNDVLFH